ncbi:hypothetical protein AAFN60_02655 [Roseibacillus persicicus]|uniref:hypothetical protein n=1 Tax=Roseibacillus persicicus TaxID=454148 RepID=UPI00398BBA2A
MNESHLTLVLAAAAGLGASAYLGTVAMYGAGKFFRVRVCELGFGVGPKLFGFQLGSAEVGFRLFPINSFVRFQDNRFPASQGDPKTSMDSRPCWVRFLIPFLGCLVPLAIGGSLLGMANAREAFFPLVEFIKGTISPFGYAQELLRSYEDFRRENGILRAAALPVFITGSLSLLPISPFAGLGQALVAIRKNDCQGHMPAWSGVSLFVFLAIVCAWIAAAAVFVFSK